MFHLYHIETYKNLMYKSFITFKKIYIFLTTVYFYITFYKITFLLFIYVYQKLLHYKRYIL